MMDAFDILGIKPTSSTKEIKKAYARLTKKFHPEENPGEWARLHSAYQRAMKWANADNHEHDGDYIFTNATSDEGQAYYESRFLREREIFFEQRDPEATEINAVFDDLEELAANARTQSEQFQLKQLAKALKELDSIENQKEQKLEDWKALLLNDEYRWAIHQGRFIYRWGKILETKGIDSKLRTFMKEQLEAIAQYNISNQQIPAKIGLLDPTQFTKSRIDSAYEKTQIKKRQIGWVSFGVVSTIIMVILIFTSEIGIMPQKKNSEQSIVVNEDKGTVKEAPVSEITQEKMQEDMDRIKSSLDSMGDITLNMMETMGEENLKLVFDKTEELREGINVSGDLNGAKLNGEGDSTIKEVLMFSEVSLPEQVETSEGMMATEGAFTFAITSSPKEGKAFLWIDPVTLGFDEGYRIYCYDGELFLRVSFKEELDNTNSANSWDTNRYLHEFLGRAVLVVNTGKIREEQYPIIIVAD